MSLSNRFASNKNPSGSLSTKILLPSLKPSHLSSTNTMTGRPTKKLLSFPLLTNRPQQLENLRYFRVRCKFQHRSRACWMTIRIKISSEDVGPQQWRRCFVRQVPGNPNSQIRFFPSESTAPWNVYNMHLQSILKLYHIYHVRWVLDCSKKVWVIFFRYEPQYITTLAYIYENNMIYTIFMGLLPCKNSSSGRLWPLLLCSYNPPLPSFVI